MENDESNFDNLKKDDDGWEIEWIDEKFKDDLFETNVFQVTKLPTW